MSLGTCDERRVDSDACELTHRHTDTHTCRCSYRQPCSTCSPSIYRYTLVCFAPETGAKYCDEYVCLSVCSHNWETNQPQGRSSPIFCMLSAYRPHFTTPTPTRLIPREDPREDVVVGIDAGVVECGLNQSRLWLCVFVCLSAHWTENGLSYQYQKSVHIYSITRHLACIEAS